MSEALASGNELPAVDWWAGLWCGPPSTESAWVKGHLMDGIPTWMGIAGIIVIILSSHLLVHFSRKRPETTSYARINLLRFRPLNTLVKQSWFPLFMQSASVMLFLLVITAGLIGHEQNNIGPVITWTWWWVLLIFLALGFGKAFCMVCPWEAISSMVSSLSLKSRVKKLGYEKPWPKWARNIFPAIIFFVILTWFELGHDVTRSASMTAILAMVMVAMAVMAALIYEKRAFCRYACLVGRVSGLYSMFAPIELRANSPDVCAQCKTKDCYTGTETTTACPTFLFPSKVDENTYCTLCTECVRSCPHNNIGLNVRPFGTDLERKKRFRWDEAILAIVLLSLTSFHGLTMTPHWTRLNQVLRAEFSIGASLCFTILMAIMLLAPILLFWAGAKLAHHFVGPKGVSVTQIFKAFAYSLVPIALFYHLAHNCMHFFMEAQHIIPLLSDPFGFGWNLFGTAGNTYPPILSLGAIWILQIIFIVAGHLYGVVLADRFARRLFHDSRSVFKSLVPLLATMILYSSFSVWLVMQPMDMRSAM